MFAASWVLGIASAAILFQGFPGEWSAPATLSFSEAIEGQVLTLHLPVANRTAGAVTLAAAQGGCGCLGTEALSLPAGAFGLVKVAVDTSGLRGFIRRRVQVPAAPAGAPLVITVEGTILPGFRTAPRALRLTPGKPAKLEISGPRSFEILETWSSLSGVQVAQEAAEAPRKRQRLWVGLAPGQPFLGATAGDLEITVAAAGGAFHLRVPMRILEGSPTPHSR